MTSALDWPALCRLGIAEMRLKPCEFWALTPAELALMAGASGARQRLGKADLGALMARFPDAAKDSGKEPEDD
ncbi:MAG: rcc01693 family protein [Pseudomonadota bacterium]